MRPGIAILVLAFLCFPTFASAQAVKVTHNVNLRPDPTSEYPPIRLLTTAEPPMSLLEPAPEYGYYHVKTTNGEEGYVWSRFIIIRTSENAAPESIHLVPPVPGSDSMAGCGDGLWQHVYHPSRLLVSQDCLTVTGTIVDASSGHNSDGVRHEKDGDTHGWLKVDPQFQSLINAGNTSNENGDLVFELVCHYNVTQTDAQPSCSDYHDTTGIPAVGTRVAITGTFVTEKNHGKWNEIHPVSRIRAQ